MCWSEHLVVSQHIDVYISHKEVLQVMST